MGGMRSKRAFSHVLGALILILITVTVGFTVYIYFNDLVMSGETGSLTFTSFAVYTVGSTYYASMSIQDTSPHPIMDVHPLFFASGGITPTYDAAIPPEYLDLGSTGSTVTTLNQASAQCGPVNANLSPGVSVSFTCAVTNLGYFIVAAAGEWGGSYYMSVALQDYGGQPLGDGAAQSTSSTTTATGQGEYTLTITAEHAAVRVYVGSTLIGVVKPHTTGKYQVQAGSSVTLLSAETTQWVMNGKLTAVGNGVQFTMPHGAVQVQALKDTGGGEQD
ncbi:hypothetical protein B9Q03_08880 [Candidatus Marsarchaeota G2 archaeon OSP_D]|jgi:hypothetical protein|uniref:Uncharacterized protein n=1 Tax=Candidatus Marsarchaeota G2 archaeon OSP_D TaxID=1978157 RepID=A0A2R6ARG2_9ARCH|nr:MAG: hypothetical protein B9Q03_08880 [Candidatus Marsarchaeota G2 archaeon OSP_D]